jgi:chromosomal replication initiation ATPase DnaA
MQSTATEIWFECLKLLKERSADAAVDTWLRPMQLTVEEGGFSLNGPNAFVTDMVFKNYADQIRWALSQVANLSATSVSRDKCCGIRIAFTLQSDAVPESN